MNKKIIKKVWKKRNILVFLAFLILLAFNLSQSFNKIFNSSQPAPFLGLQFKHIQKFIKGTPRIGYIHPDFIKDDNIALGLLGRAQYILIPTVLEPNNIDLPFTIFFASEKITVGYVKSLGLTPVAVNSFGIILAKNPKFK